MNGSLFSAAPISEILAVLGRSRVLICAYLETRGLFCCMRASSLSSASSENRGWSDGRKFVRNRICSGAQTGKDSQSPENETPTETVHEFSSGSIPE